jgi:hypothetical protein
MEPSWACVVVVPITSSAATVVILFIAFMSALRCWPESFAAFTRYNEASLRFLPAAEGKRPYVNGAAQRS